MEPNTDPHTEPHTEQHTEPHTVWDRTVWEQAVRNQTELYRTMLNDANSVEQHKMDVCLSVYLSICLSVYLSISVSLLPLHCRFMGGCVANCPAS